MTSETDLVEIHYEADNGRVYVRAATGEAAVQAFEAVLASASAQALTGCATASGDTTPQPARNKRASKKKAAVRSTAASVEAGLSETAGEVNARGAGEAEPEMPAPEPSEPASGQPDETPPSDQEIRAALVKLGRERGVALLNRYGAEKISAIPSEQRAPLLAEARAELG